MIDGYDPFFSHQRNGKNEEPFTIHKLRTMPPEAPSDVASTEGYADYRATKLGNMLRKARLDEVPQLINIYKGDMSVVGPRPLVPAQYEEIMDSLDLTDQKAWRQARSAAKPGMLDTFGISSYQNGYASQTVAERVEADIVYYEQASFSTDIRIIGNSLKLIPKLFMPTSAEKTHEYRRGATLLASAAHAFGIEVNEQEFCQWDSLFQIVKVLDNQIDEEGITDISQTIHEAFLGDSPFLSPELSHQFSLSMHHLTPEKRQNIEHSLNQMPVFSVAKKTARSAKELTDISRQEALTFASILHLDNEDNHSQRASFNAWLNEVAQAGELLDACFDLRSDHKLKTVTIKPHLRNRLYLGRKSFEHIGPLLRQQDFRTTIQLAKTALTCFTDR